MALIHEKFDVELDRWRWTSGKNRWTCNQKPLTCEFCGFEPRTKNKYREKQDHLVEKHFKDEIDKIIPFCSPYVCPAKGCDYNGKDKQGISRHYTGKHGILEKLLQEALVANDLKNIVKNSLKKNYPCKVCKKDFHAKPSLRQHLTTKTHLIIAAELGISSDSVCEIEKSKKEQLPKIAINLQRRENKVYKCKICSSTFSRSGELKRHVIGVHEGKKPYKCKICNTKFLVNSVRKKHVLAIHKRKDYAVLKCSICKINFSEKKLLKKHNKSVHNTKKPHICSVCGTRFASRNYWNLHVKTVHEKKMPFKCAACEEGFSTKKELFKHIRSFHELKKLIIAT